MALSGLGLVECAKVAAGLAARAQVTEAHTVEHVVAAGGADPRALRQAVQLAQADPDALPLVVAVLARAAQAATVSAN